MTQSLTNETMPPHAAKAQRDVYIALQDGIPLLVSDDIAELIEEIRLGRPYSLHGQIGWSDHLTLTLHEPEREDFRIYHLTFANGRKS